MNFSDDEIERYARHLVLAELGGPGQQKLKAARVAVMGLGGVGSPAALYLAAGGVGSIRLIDDDEVALSNLQRQIAFATHDVGTAKTVAGASALRALNPHVEVQERTERLTAGSAVRLLDECDLVLDGTDDFDTRLAVNEACLELGIPLVSGALGRWSGQVGLFEGRPCYRCLVSSPPPDAETCARLGVVGALAGVIGSMSALEALKRLTGAGATLSGRLLIYDGLAGTSRTVKVAADPTCASCGS